MINIKNSKWNSFDFIVIGYCLLSIVTILILGRPLSDYGDEIKFYIFMALLALSFIIFLDENKNNFFRFVRLFYPGFMFTFFYRETDGLMGLFYEPFFDLQLTMFENAVLGFNPTLLIDKYLLNVFVNEFLSLCYFSYYLLIPWFMFYAFFKKDYLIIKSFVKATCITFFLSYMIFSLYPIEGPRWFFQADYINNIEGFIFRPLVVFIISKGAVHGGCMPSSHFAVALVIQMYCYKYYKKTLPYITTLVTGLAIGTFWGRFHYVTDVIVGGIIGLTVVLIIWKLKKKEKEMEFKPKPEEITV
ncbi:phosphatase PAP2 family protein [Candidatus Zixiibacteriota bacterium]